MSPPLEIMTAVPTRQSSVDVEATIAQANTKATPVLALKELVATLHREQNKIQNLLSSLGFALRSFNNLNQFLELTPLMAARVTDAEGGALILSQAEGGFRLEQLYGQPSQTTQKLRSTIEQAIRSEQSGAGSFYDSLDAKLKQDLKGLRLFGTSILVKNVERGRLYILSNKPDYAWTPTRQKLAQLVADQTAVAIANHELTVELRSKERQERELEIASEIQLRLLPRNCPQIRGVDLAARCKTANRVGGDYYDFIPTNYDQLRQNSTENDLQTASVPWSIVIGDVMGKGVPAGLIMTMTRGMLRAEVLNRHSPEQVLQHLNRVMYADLENSHRFVTLFYSEYDPQTGMLAFSNAAHHPPLLWSAKDHSTKQLDTWGMWIGLDANSEYHSATEQLHPGDKIIYYTDGFTDAINQHGERFDEENLLQAFEWACQHTNTAQEMLDYLFEEIETFVGSGSHSDDMTLIVMQIEEVPEGQGKG